jgi:hypothetical protein
MGYKKNGGAIGKAQAGTEIKKAQAPAGPAGPAAGVYKEGRLSEANRPKTQTNTYSAPKITKDTATAPPMKSKGGAIKYGMGGAAPKKKMGGSAPKASMGGSMKYGMGGAMKAKMGGAMKTKKK